MLKATLAFCLFLFCFFSASALDPTHFTIQRISSPYFVVDGNSPATGPKTAYVGFKITNTSASVTYSNLRFTINSITSSVAGQNYTSISPSSGISNVGTLSPGQSRVCYYYISYPAHTTAQATFNYTLADASASSKTESAIIYNRASISANAGGLATQSINNQDLIGGIVTDDVTYTLGNIRNGDEADFQVSVSTQFDPTKLVLLKTEVTASTVPGITSGTIDKLHFNTTANQSSGSVTIRWTFRISAFNFTSLILPYAGATSGSTNYKYAISTDLGGGTPLSVSASANPLVITKTSDKVTYGAMNTALFTVTIQNPGAYAITIDKITDEVPTGFIYQSLDAGSEVTALNSTSLPVSGSSGTIEFEGGVSSGSNTSYTVPASGSIVLKYTAVAPGVQASNLLTTARGFIGTTQFGLAQNTVNVSATLPVTLTSFKAALTNDHVTLKWSTSTESNSSHYVIEKSNTNSGFKAIGTITAKGNSLDNTFYSMIDSFPLAGKNHYRLKMVDIDGKFEYSPVVSIEYKQKEPIHSVYPNPFIHELKLSINLKEEQALQIMLTDQQGQVNVNETHRGSRGRNEITLRNLQRLQPGIYLMTIVTNQGVFTQKVVKAN